MNNTIGVIGGGMIGSQVARLALNAGYQVIICNSRGPETLDDLIKDLGKGAKAAHREEVAREAELIVLAVPFAAYAKLPSALLEGKILIDTLNYYPERDGVMPEVKTDSVATSEWVQRHLSGSKVVRAINNMDFVRLLNRARPAGAADRSALPIASDFPDAKARVVEFLDKIGYDSVDMGALAESWRSEPTMPVYVNPYWGQTSVYTAGPSDVSSFMSAPGRPVPKHEVEQLLNSAVRHDKMFGSLGNFDLSKS